MPTAAITAAGSILNNVNGQNIFYTSGNAGNGSNPQPDGVILGAGAQLITPSSLPEALQSPGVTTPLASFSVTALGDKADKIGKDDNFRGIGVYNNVVYYTKGSGSNGVNTGVLRGHHGHGMSEWCGRSGAGRIASDHTAFL
jgi:hypothetical protein